MLTGNEPANPSPEYVYDKMRNGHYNKNDEPDYSQYTKTFGLTIRQHFAVMAMQGLLAGGDMQIEMTEGRASVFAQESVLMADALINELNK